MAAALHHRGPDGAGVYRDPHCGLAHTRLSIIDLAGGAQPMCDVDGQAYVVFNGEIFNYVELRSELVALGYAFETRSDTEVVVQALRAWGEEALVRFNGQFSIALWWPRERTLLLARDRHGVRPLHVCEHAGRVYFASEVKAIFAADPGIPRELDATSLVETLTFWTVLAPRSMFRGVEELRPGHVRVYTPDGVRERCYWEPSFPTSPGPAIEIADAADTLRGALARATTRRLRCADVPVACYLSGGLDSSVIAALGQRAHGDGLRTFSLRFADADFDEGPFQHAMVERLHTEHTEVEISHADIADVFPTAIRHIERPILRTAPAPMLLLARHVRDAGIKVVLTGEGADEMLAGYDLFREARLRRFWAREPRSERRPLLLERLYPYLRRSPGQARAMARAFFGRDLDRPGAPDFAHGPRWSSATALQRLLHPDIRRAAASDGDPIQRLVATLPAAFSSWDPLARDQYLEIRTLLSGYLLASQGDRVAMASSVEGRYPFLDNEVVDLACSLPPDHKLRVLDEKHVLKRAAEDLVPRSIVHRPKQPFRAPDAIAFCGPHAPGWVAEELDPRSLEGTGVFDPAAVAQLWDKCRTRGHASLSNADNMALTAVISTQLLHRELIRGRPDRDPPIPIQLVLGGSQGDLE
jgi:asparagine synthase (glutamine-hydrolysing)